MRRWHHGGDGVLGPRRFGAPDQRAEAPAGVPLEWIESWGAAEAERVTRWLTAKGRPPAGGAADGLQGVETPPRSVTVDTLDMGPWDVPPVRSVPAPPVPAERGREDHLAEQAGAAALLEAELAELEEARRQLAVALDVERSEAERVRRERLVARSDLEAEITWLEEQRRRLLVAAETAARAAEQAVQEERDATAALEVAHLEAKRRECQHFEVWAALDAEVDSLRARRRRLRARRRRPAADRTAAGR